jgi:hypothetical protein
MQDEDKQNTKKHNTTHKTKKMSNTKLTEVYSKKLLSIKGEVTDY